MANRILKPDSSNNLILQDGDSVSRVTLNSGGTSVLSDEGGTSALSIQADGDIDIAENIYLASGKGIYFDGQTTATHFLDDYEEGSWTASWTLGSGTATIVHNYNELSYTRIGSIVFCSGRIENTAVSSPSGTCRLSGLPFPAAQLSGTDDAGSYWSGGCINAYGLNAMTGNTNISLVIYAGNSYAQLYEATTTGHANMGDHLTATTALIVNFWYRA